MAWFRGNYNSEENSIPLVSWGGGTSAQILAMIEGYYNGDIPLSAIQSVWSIGDKRTIRLDAMTSTQSFCESHHADSYDFVIIDFDHDLLTTPINGKTRALITVQQDRLLYKNTTDTYYTTSYPSETNEGGRMNFSSDQSNSTGWNTCDRRTWCNSIYYNAFPQFIKNIIKEVYKSTAITGGSSPSAWIANTDKCFLLSEREIFGAALNSLETGVDTIHYINNISETTINMPTGGTQYPIFSNVIMRCKKPTYYSSNQSGFWWTRSPYKTNFLNFCSVGSMGYGDYRSSNSSLGIVPAFCL